MVSYAAAGLWIVNSNLWKKQVEIGLMTWLHPIMIYMDLIDEIRFAFIEACNAWWLINFIANSGLMMSI